MFLSEDEFEKNKNAVLKDKTIRQLLETLTEIRDFLNELGYLTFGRDFSVIRITGVIEGNIVLESASRTMESIRCCCMSGNFADAYTLLRKFRDDLFYYLYLLVVADKSDLTKFVELDKLSSDEKNIWEWAHNKQKDLYIGSVLKCTALHPSAKKAIKIYGLKESFDKIADNLNNYVHSNGYFFYNEPYSKLIVKQKIEEKCNGISEMTIYITITFLFLMVLIRPLLIMSYDYIDYLDCGDVPPEGSQYWVAPFVSQFFEKYKNVLDENIINYLRENTEMQI